ncbi:hypothetical protein F030043B2_03950 [Bacteroides fragilis]
MISHFGNTFRIPFSHDTATSADDREPLNESDAMIIFFMLGENCFYLEDVIIIIRSVENKKPECNTNHSGFCP